MSIAVTGTSGHLGSLIVEALAAKVSPDTIVALARNVPRAETRLPAGTAIRPADYDIPDSLNSALNDVATLVLVSGSEVGNRVRQHRSVIDAAVRAGVTRVVYTSLLNADTATANPLAGEHLATEDYLRASGLQFTILRNGWYTENFLGSAQQAVATGEFSGSAGSGRVASASRADYALAAATVAAEPGHEGSIYSLGGDVSWNYDGLAVMISEISGRHVTYRDLSPKEHSDALVALGGLDEATAAFIVAVDGAIKAGELDTDSNDLAVLIGRATTPPAQTLADLLSADE
ncbi:SDR family oxidoreductase [Rarobacter faecitabidus]|uniref:NAD(P)H dehydrogenase (Quinone) n=1 Tax=Rarobacter faecitabidus TaxID=13243 RepID=A0A542ZT88_RARFA|nr:SDR family oxidoreductase [Rarobacter faecitabidus]TQL63573.1 NAD(P)H dehydrogenase (quinone) [Rarobacter faecitabidus]